ncbi:MAG: 23S rRNA (uracil(1939)-C(5))-methyltransferase RlmD [Rhodothermales bacterium]|nr:23S rRNA (uracil(1939)-C(5))-methyltransferase RlmD [Rhodothermales bacterium]
MTGKRATRGSELRVTIEKFADRGKSLARFDGMVIFVAGAVPGDEVDVRLRKVKKKFAEGEVIRLVRESAIRTEAVCRYFGYCGGCKWQHVDYSAQLEAKRQSVREALEHTGGISGIDVRPTIGSESIYLYRNKMEFSFSAQRWLTKAEIQSGESFDKSFALGLHAPGQYAKVIDLEECHLQSTESQLIVNRIRELARESSWSLWDTKRHEGLLRHLVIREGKRTGDRMVNLVTSQRDESVIGRMSDVLQSPEFAVSTFVNTINDTPAQTALGSATHVIFGPGSIRERIGDFEFTVRPQSFFQTNTLQAERLYRVARDLAELQSDDTLYDLYCGAGTIALFLSPFVRRVVGIEVVRESVEDAIDNAKRNGVENSLFVEGDVARMVDSAFVAEHGTPDVLVVDPPRAGLHPKVLKSLLALRPDRLVYVSCNPQTQARDLAALAEGYSIDVVQPVDMFPHTHHTESVARLTAVQRRHP